MYITKFIETVITKIDRGVDSLYRIDYRKNFISKLYKLFIKIDNGNGSVPNPLSFDIQTGDKDVVVNEVNVLKNIVVDPRILIVNSETHAINTRIEEIEKSLIDLIRKKMRTEAIIVEFSIFSFGAIKNNGKVLFIDFVTGNVIDFKNINDLPFWLYSKGITTEKCNVRNLQLVFKNSTKKKLFFPKTDNDDVIMQKEEEEDVIESEIKEMDHVTSEVVVIDEKPREDEALDITLPRSKKRSTKKRRAIQKNKRRGGSSKLKRKKITKKRTRKGKLKKKKNEEEEEEEEDQDKVRNKRNYEDDDDNDDGKNEGIFGNSEVKRNGRKIRKLE